jgi:tRNA(fMet)-specific endonuclease VapC
MTLYVIDTDLLSLYQRNHPQVSDRVRLARQNGIMLTTTVVTVEEQYAGRLAQIRKAKNPDDGIVVTRNRKDFEQVSNLKIEDWSL